MVGHGLKKLAQENNLNISQGIAYGNFRGYAVTFNEGAGFKLMRVATMFLNPQKKDQLNEVLNSRNLYKEFRVQEIGYTQNCINIVFFDNPGTMKMMYAFMDWFFPLLDMYEATRFNICTECGCEVTSGQWLIIDETAYYMHNGCAQNLQSSYVQEVEERKRQDRGSYVRGLIGALAGAALGAVVWAIVFNLGYIAGIVGFLIGWLAEKGYDLLRGKKGKGKIVILLLSVVLGVLFGTLLGEVSSIVIMILNGELAGWSMTDVPFLLSLLMDDASYVSTLRVNIITGMAFAILGVVSLLIRAGKDVSRQKIRKTR